MGKEKDPAMEFIKLNAECQTCLRLRHNGGSCSGKTRLRAPCLAHKVKDDGKTQSPG